MSFILFEPLIFIVIAAVCGAIGGVVAGDVRGGFLVSVVLGFTGALLGPWAAAQLKLKEPLTFVVNGHVFPILWSISGAALFVGLAHLFWGRRLRRLNRLRSA